MVPHELRPPAHPGRGGGGDRRRALRGQAAATCAVQNAQRLAAIGISLRHSGHWCVSSATGGSVRNRDSSVFTGLITKKNSTVATIRNAISALMKSPWRN